MPNKLLDTWGRRNRHLPDKEFVEDLELYISKIEKENAKLREALTNCRQVILWHLGHSKVIANSELEAFFSNSEWAVKNAESLLNPVKP